MFVSFDPVKMIGSLNEYQSATLPLDIGNRINSDIPRMEIHASHSSLMPRKLVQHLARLNFPNSNGPISTSCRYSLSAIMSCPRTSYEGLLKTCWCAGERSVHAHGVGRKGSDVVDDESRIESIGGEVMAVRRERKGNNGIGVAVKRVENFVRSKVPYLQSVSFRTEITRGGITYLDGVVNSTNETLVPV